MKAYRIRAHHGMCLAFFEGKGYSGEFTRHMEEIREGLKQNPVITLTDKTDDICSLCPNNKEGICTAAEKVEGYDRAVLSLCGLSSGQRIPWQAFENLVEERILAAGRRAQICGNCGWDPVCQKSGAVKAGKPGQGADSP